MIFYDLPPRIEAYLLCFLVGCCLNEGADLDPSVGNFVL